MKNLASSRRLVERLSERGSISPALRRPLNRGGRWQNYESCAITVERGAEFDPLPPAAGWLFQGDRIKKRGQQLRIEIVGNVVFHEGQGLKRGHSLAEGPVAGQRVEHVHYFTDSAVV